MDVGTHEIRETFEASETFAAWELFVDEFSAVEVERWTGSHRIVTLHEALCVIIDSGHLSEQVSRDVIEALSIASMLESCYEMPSMHIRIVGRQPRLERCC